MKPSLSVIIPVLHEAGNINSLLDHVALQAGPSALEVIVADGADEKDTLAAIRRDSVIPVSSSPGRGKQMNAGAAAAQGDILLFLHADTRLPEGGLADVERIMAGNAYVGGAFDLGIDSKHWFLKMTQHVGTLRSRLTRVPYGDQAIFIRRSFFESIGGYRELPLMEDVDLMRRIKRAGGRICFIPKRVSTSARRWEKDGAIRGTLRNWVLISLYLLGVPPERLVKFYK